MGVEIAFSECFQFWHMHRFGQMSGGNQHRIETLDRAIGQHDLPHRRIARGIEGRTHLLHLAVETDPLCHPEMVGVAHQIAVHVIVVGERLGPGVEIQVAETGDAARCVDVQRAVGGRPAAVIIETPHAADLAADFEHRHIEAGLQQVLRRTQAAGPGPDHCHALGPALVGTQRRAAQAALIYRLHVRHLACLPRGPDMNR